MNAVLEGLRRRADLLADRARMGGDPAWQPVDTLSVELREAGARISRDWTRRTTPELASAFELSVVRLLLSAEAHHDLGPAIGAAVFLNEVGADLAKARVVACGMRPDALAIYTASAIARPPRPIAARWHAAWVAALCVAGLERLAGAAAGSEAAE